MSYFLPLRFPYQFLPLLLLGLSVEVEKSDEMMNFWVILLYVIICYFWSPQKVTSSVLHVDYHVTGWTLLWLFGEPYICK